MSPLFKKLNFKGHTEILVLNAPASFEPELNALEGAAIVQDMDLTDSIYFALVFATKQSEVDFLSEKVTVKSKSDVVLWFAYPKATSKLYKCDFNRDTGWSKLRKLGFDSVRQVAIDENWSALRFRRNEHIGR